MRYTHWQRKEKQDSDDPSGDFWLTWREIIKIIFYDSEGDFAKIKDSRLFTLDIWYEHRMSPDVNAILAPTRILYSTGFWKWFGIPSVLLNELITIKEY